jgi:hypothetical protein
MTDSKDGLTIKETVNSQSAIRSIMIIILIGCIGIVIYALQGSNFGQFANISSVGVMVAGASLLMGGLFGFLFGIPRTNLRPLNKQPSTTTEIENDSKEAGLNRVAYQPNTNLEDISDWLTKIIVGVGLTQLANIPSMLQEITSNIAINGFGNLYGSQTFALAELIYFVTCGFLLGFLWTRLYLMGAFAQADVEVLRVTRSQVSDMQAKVNQVEIRLTKKDISEKAITLVATQLIQAFPQVDSSKLTEALKETTPDIRLQLYSQAEKTRSENWQDEEKKSLMERTIPIFKALIDTDPTNFRYFGSLGFALKDSKPPLYDQAIDNLNRAIDLRGDVINYPWYELVRAQCKINQDENYLNDQPTDQEVSESIIRDLRIASVLFPLRDDGGIKHWCEINGIKEFKNISWIRFKG